MKKIKTAVLFMFLVSAANIYAYDVRFGWNIGNVKFYYDALNKDIGGSIEVLHFNWLINDRLYFGLNAMDFTADEKISILPLEIAYVPFIAADFLYFTIYGRAGWQLTDTGGSYKHGFFASAGVQFYIFFDSYFFYSPYISFFAEYEFTKNALKIGGGIDLFVFLAMISPDDGRNGRYNRRGHRH